MKIGQIANPSQPSSEGHYGGPVLLIGNLCKKPREEIGFKRFLTFDLYLGQVKGQRKICDQKSLAQVAKYHGMSEFWPSLHGTSQFVHSFVIF